MRTSFLILAATIGASTASKTACAQPATIKLSLARPDWVSAEEFSTVSAIRVLPNGTVLVADWQEVEAKLLDATGKLVRQVGRKGSGPGEYSSVDKLIALPHDSTLLLDLGGRRYLLLDPTGKISSTHSFPEFLGKHADQITSADDQGRLLFSATMTSVADSQHISAPIGRWKRGADHYDTVAMISLEDPTVQKLPKLNPAMKDDWVFQTRVVFAAADDWVAARSGRIAIIHAKPYRVDWVEKSGRTTTGVPVSYTAVPVADADRKEREPKGPPYVRQYAAVKAPFMSETAVVDDADNVWIPRLEAANATTRRWDVFSSRGKLLTTLQLPANRRILAINRSHAYIVYTDDDGLKRVERYTR